VTPDDLLRAYAMGIFPMAQSRDDDVIHWIDPKRRGIFPLEGFHVSKNLARHIRRVAPVVTFDTAFAEVVTACADRPETWINDEIFSLYNALHALGHAHSAEIWQGERLVGGVYGVVIGAAFFGESMFSRAENGSKMALAFLVERLREGGFTLFDTQFLTPHLASLGAVEISRAEYHRRLAPSIAAQARFQPSEAGTSQRSTQTS
jgi:leucyl/phenylalanyl-tRNA---protein transferase